MHTIERIGNLITRIDGMIVSPDDLRTYEAKMNAKTWNPVLKLWSDELVVIQNELRKLKGELIEKL